MSRDDLAIWCEHGHRQRHFSPYLPSPFFENYTPLGRRKNYQFQRDVGFSSTCRWINRQVKFSSNGYGFVPSSLQVVSSSLLLHIKALPCMY
jgi:hypothetical protein